MLLQIPEVKAAHNSVWRGAIGLPVTTLGEIERKARFSLDLSPPAAAGYIPVPGRPV